MKKSTWVRVLLMVLSLVMVLSVLAGCGNKEELEALKAQVEEIKKQTESNTTNITNNTNKVDQAETKAVVAELRTLVDSIKVTADAAATAAKLEEAVTKLDTADKADAAAAAAALEEAKTALQALITANGTADAATKAALEAAVADIAALETAAATKAELLAQAEELKAEIAKKEDSAELEATLAELNAKIATLATKEEMTAAVKACQDALQAKIDGLTAQFTELAAKVNQNTTDIADLKALVAEVKSQIEKLHAEDFVGDYNEATEALREGEYSLAAFETLAATVKEADYADEDYEAYKKKVADLTFFLNRALSVEQIKGYFAELNKMIEEMPTLTESLDKMLTNIESNKTITTDPKCLDELKAIYNKITGEVEAALQTRYTTVVDAHNELLDAVEAAPVVVAEIEKITAPIVYLDSLDAIVAAETVFATYKADFFANENYTKLYAEGITAEAMISNYKDLADARARYDLMATAAASKINVIEKALAFTTDSVLWSDLAELQANMTDITENWISKYTVDEANIAKIYGEEYTTLQAAITYATAMTTLYTEHTVVDLVANIDALCAKELVVITDTETAAAYRAKLNALEAAIKATEGYIDADKNYESMIGAELLAKFAAVEARLVELAQAKAEVLAIVEQMVAMQTRKVTFTDFTTIKEQYDEGLTKICTDYNIVEGDANYVEFVAGARELCEKLFEEYKELTKEVARIYVLVDEAMNSPEGWPLSRGNEILELENYFTELILMGVEDINLDLTLIIDGQEVSENLKTLSKNWTTCVTAFNAKAQKAQSEAVDVNGLIEALDSAKLTDVKYFATVEAAWNAFATWAQTHLGIDVNTASAEEVRAAIEAIQAIHILSDAENCYKFVTLANYDVLAKAYADAKANLAAAEAERQAIVEAMNALVTKWNIHSDFETVNDRYLAYVQTYFAGVIDVDSQLDGEYTLYTDSFAVVMADYTAKKAAAVTDATAIKNAIEALGDATFANAQSVIDAVNKIREDVAKYEDTYGCAILTCDICGVTADEVLTLAKAEAKANYSLAYATRYNELTDEAVKAELMTAYERYNYQLDKAASEQVASTIQKQAISALVDYVDPTPAP